MLDVFNQNKYKTTDSHVLEYTGATTDPRVARVVKYLGQATANNPDLFHAMIMEDLMEAEAERDRIERARERAAKEEAVQAKEEAVQAKEEAIQAEKVALQAAEAERKEKEFWKAQFEAMQQKN